MAASAGAAGSVKVVVTGGKGFLGRYLCQTLLRRRRVSGRPLDTLAILDAGADTQVSCDTDVQVFPNAHDKHSLDKGVVLQQYGGDITDKGLVAEALRPRAPGQQICVLHLASVMSGEGEANFDRCLRVNVDGTRNLLEASRALLQQGESGGAPVRFIFPSSFAAFGPTLEVDDDTRLAPQSTYGTTKAVAELLVNDFTRKGWVDGRTGRLPTVIVRPGSANAAATGCFSAVVREPLMGNGYTIPVSPTQRHPVISMRRTVKGLLALAELPGDALGHDRAVNMPALQVTLEELLFHTQQIAQGRGIPLGEVSVKIDPQVSRIVDSMPRIMWASRARRLGLPRDSTIEEIIEGYVDEFLDDETSCVGYPLLSM